MSSPIYNLISGAPAAAITLCIAVGIFHSILGTLSLRKFALGAFTGLPVVALSGAAWTLLSKNYLLPDWLDIGFLIPVLVGVAASIWTTQLGDAPTTSGIESRIAALAEITDIAQQEQDRPQVVDRP